MKPQSPRAQLVALAFLTSLILAVSGCTQTSTHAAGPGCLSSLVCPVMPALEPAAAPVTPEAPSQAPNAPYIYPRSTWADADPIPSRLEPMGKITRITVHHEGMDPESEAPMEYVKDELRRIRKSHLERMHAGDIGYHYIIDCNGRIIEGRPIKYQGAHAGNPAANRGNIGIVLMGNFNIQKCKPAQLASLRTLLEYLMDKYDIPVSQLYTHREVYKLYGLGTTDCPGENLQRDMVLLRTRLAQADKK